ncbi:MAG: hypothetical protein ACLU94_05440 [Catenibacillus sp.]
MTSQRAAGGGSAVWRHKLNGLLRAARNIRRIPDDPKPSRVGAVGNQTRYQ